MRWRGLLLLALVPVWVQAQSQAQKDGRKVAREVARAMGLKDKQPVHALRATFSQGEGASVTTITATIVEPDHLRAEIRSNGGVTTAVFTPNEAFVVMADGAVHDVPDYQKQESLEQVVRDPIYLAGHWNDPEIQFISIAADRVNDVPVRIVDVSTGTVKVRWYVEEKSGHLVREEYQSLGEHGRIASATELSDWRTMGGLVVPAKHENYQGEQVTSVVVQTGLEVNPAVDGKAFERPAKP